MALFYDRKENKNEIVIIFKTGVFYIAMLFFVLTALVYISFRIDETWKPIFALVFPGTLFILILGRAQPMKEIAKAMKKGYVEVKGSTYSFENPHTYRIKK